ncbi:MAG: phosphoribosyl-AMP cyclohydrolase [Candidatus Thermoplasmatota archaeon]
MSKARKVKVAAKAAKPKPAPARPAVRRLARSTKAEPKAADKAPARAGIARLAALAAAEAGSDEPEIQVRSKSAAPAPKGGVAWEDFEDDEDAAPPAAVRQPPQPVLVTPTKPVVEEGVQLVARGPSKFSMADIEALRAAIKVKGATNIIDGVNLDELKFDGEGLIPVVAQDRRTGAVLTIGWGSKETLGDTLRTKQVTLFDRVRQKAAAHSEGSGRHQRLVKLLVDCDKDAVLLTVEQEGPACNRDTGTCFTDGRNLPLSGFLGELEAGLLAQAKAKEGPDAKLLAEPIEALRQFVGTANTISKALQGKEQGAIEQAAADLLRALLVACRARGVSLERIVTDLYARQVSEKLKK